jgi:hypothetical protein
MPPLRSIGRTAARRHVTAHVVDPAADLSGLGAEQWEGIDEAIRDKMMKSIDERYKQYLTNFYETSNLCVRKHDASIKQHRMWRYIAIIGTGLLACLNFIAARRSMSGVAVETTLLASAMQGLINMTPIAAALGALTLAVLANLETFANSVERAQAYRESREQYLDAAEEYNRAWSVAVVALGDTAQAYSNAVELYRRIVAADRDLRRSFKELTKPVK